MEKINNCPVCNSTNFVDKLHCQDHTATHETFTIVSCQTCNFLFTNSRPRAEELSRYYESPDYISHTNKSDGLLNKTYQIVRNYTIARKNLLVQKYATIGNIVDIGSGTGEFVNALTKTGWNAIGIEPNTKARTNSCKQYRIKAEDESFLSQITPATIDVVTMWHVLEHVPNLNSRIEEIYNLLKPNAKLILALPNHTSFDAHFFNKCWAAYDVPRHLYHFSPKDIERLASKHKFEVINVLPMYFDSFYVSILSAKYSGKNIITAVLIALLSNIKAVIKNDNSYSSQIYILQKK